MTPADPGPAAVVPEPVRPPGGGVLPPLTALVTRFRAAASPAELLERAPRQIVDLGFDRCLVSRVEHGRWVAHSSYVGGDAGLARAITRAGSESPLRLDRRVLESELVRRSSPLLVLDAQDNPRVHRRLVDVTATTAYVAAPVRVDGALVGLVHVDRTDRATVSQDDVELVGLVVECLGAALERLVAQEHLRMLRRSLRSWSSSARDLLDATGPDLAPVTPTGGPPAGTSAPPRPVHLLTTRELEVLERIAAGEVNVEIAPALHIAETTVKAHVKHIFRKLGVANRAEAVSSYLRR